MGNFAQGMNVWIIAGGAFVLGVFIAWLYGRARRSRLAQDYERQLSDAQRTQKRTQDDLESVQSQLDAQRNRAEQLTADKATLQSSLDLAEQTQADAEENLVAIQESLAQESERREAAEVLLEQSRSQALELQNALDDTHGTLLELESRIGDEAEARADAEAALKAKEAEFAALTGELEALNYELSAAQREMAAAVERERSASLTESDADEPEIDTESVTYAVFRAAEDSVEMGDDQSMVDNTQERIAELSLSINALASMGADLSLALDKRDKENLALRAQLAAYQDRLQPSAATPVPENLADRDSEVSALQDELYKAIAESAELENLLAEAQQESEQAAMELLAQVEMFTAEANSIQEMLQEKDADLTRANARLADLEDQLSIQSETTSKLEMQFESMNIEHASLVARLDEIQDERDVLSRENAGMRARLEDRTEEVNALTVATVAAAATIKRRDEALKLSEAATETLRSEYAEIAEAKAALESAMAERDAVLQQSKIAQGKLQAEIESLTVASFEATATLHEREAALQEAIAKGEQGSDELNAKLQDLRSEVESAEAKLESRNERLERLTKLVQSITAGQGIVQTTPAKQAALRNALMLGVTPGELAQPQDLSKSVGIGVAYTRRLHAAGIGTFWELASISEQELLEALGLEHAQQLRVDPSEIRADAYRLAEESGSVGMIWEGGGA